MSLYIREDVASENTLHSNAFYLLGVSTRDNRRKIVEAAEEKNLVLDEAVCNKVRSDLTNPRNRLAVEIAWLSGISPKRASELTSLLSTNPEAIKDQNNIPSLPLANLLAAGFERIGEQTDAQEWADWIELLAETVDEIDSEDILRDINEDRAVSGFPTVKSISDIESALGNQKRYYKDSVRDALNRLPSTKLVEVVTDVVENTTENGDFHASSLVDAIVDTYEVDAQNFLTQEADNVRQLVEATKVTAERGFFDRIPPLLNKIDSTVRNWDAVAQPIQVSMKSRGLDHEMSSALAYDIRSLGIDLFNKYDLIDSAQQMTETLQDVFAELPEVVERLDEDISALEDIAFSRDEAKRASERKASEFEQEISFHAEIGAVFKDTLAISLKGVQWKNTTIPLEKITRVRWGATRHSINGIPSGTTHSIYFGDDRKLMHVETRKEAIYNEFIDKLWRAVCVRLWVDTLHGLREGKKYRFGDAVVDDKGVQVTTSGFFSGGQKKYGTWGDLQTWTSNGNYVIGFKGEKKAYSAMAYQNVDNVHILSAAISAGFKHDVSRLSDMLD